MILGNKCDMDHKRMVSKLRGESVSEFFVVSSDTFNTQKGRFIRHIQYPKGAFHQTHSIPKGGIHEGC